MRQKTDLADERDAVSHVPIIFALNSSKTVMRESVEKELLISLLRQAISQENLI